MIIPSNIKKAYKIIIGCIGISLIVGIIFNKSQFYFGYPVGAVGSMLILYTLNREVYEMVYVKEKNIRSPFGYYKRLFIMGMSLLIVSLVSKYFFPSKVEINIALAGLGLITSKLVLFIGRKVER